MNDKQTMSNQELKGKQFLFQITFHSSFSFNFKRWIAMKKFPIGTSWYLLERRRITIHES